MKRLLSLTTLLSTSFIIFTIPVAKAGGCSSHFEKKVELECLPSDKKCLEKKEKDNLKKIEV